MTDHIDLVHIDDDSKKRCSLEASLAGDLVLSRMRSRNIDVRRKKRPIRWPRFGEVIQIAGLSLGDWEHDGNATNDSSDEDEDENEDEDEDENNNAEVHDGTNADANTNTNTSTNDNVNPDVNTDDTGRDGQAYYHYHHRGTGLRVRLPNRQLNDYILTRM